MSRVTLVLKTNEGGMWVLPQIAELVRRGHVVTTLIPEGDGRLRRALDLAGLPVVETGFGFAFRPRASLVTGLLRLRREIRATHPDLLFYHLYASALAVRLASIGLGAPRVHMVAGPLYLESSTIRIAERVLRRLDSHIIAGSAYTARLYRAIGQPRSRLSVIPYGVDLARFRRGLDQRTVLFGCSPTTFVAIVVAYVYAPKRSVFPGVGIKGHEVLLDAWADFCSDHPDSLLVLVGSGFDTAGEEHRQRLIALHGGRTTQRLLWVDSVEDVRPYYSSADVSVSPSISENHGAALEASAMGLPSIVTDAGGLPETVSPESGWLAPAGDAPALVTALRAAARCFQDGSLVTMGQAARQLAKQRFDVSVSASRLADRIERVAAARPTVLIVTEQRCWSDASGHVVGRKHLQAASGLAAFCSCIVVARRTTPAPPGVRLLDTDEGALLVPWPTSLAGIPTGLTAARMLWRAVGASDAVMVFCPGILGTIAGTMALVRRKKLIATAVGDPATSLAPDVVGQLASRMARPVVTRAMREFCKRAAVVRYVTTTTLQRAYPPGPATVAVAGTDVGQLALSTPRRHRTGPVELLTVVTLDRAHKGVRELIAAVRQLRDSGHDVRLCVAGNGRLESELRQLAEDLLQENARFVGHVTGEALQALYRTADVFVLASWAEGLPRVLVEAMAAGMPCVATAVDGVPELLEPKRLAQPRDIASLARAIEDLITDPEGWEMSSANNLRTASVLLLQAASAEAAFAEAAHRLLVGRS